MIGRVTCIAVALLFLFASASLHAAKQDIRISTPEQIKAEFDSVPCKNGERLNAVRALFEKMGAAASDIAIDKYKDVENLVIRKQGRSEEKIIIGAHYDKVAEGCGAIDNWTGIVAIAHLYSSLKDVPLSKTILFVAFGKEELGLVGSHAMAEAIPKDQRRLYCEMINIDSFGLAAPQVGDNMSSEKLASFVVNLAKEMKVPFSHASIPGAGADSMPFMEKKIPAVTLHGLSNAWPKILHTGNDQSSRINPVSVYLGYRLSLALVVRLDSSACDAYR
jgi:acetylornithine deacetylase/succinyl-diaminopimelate desuccinylase-like protein